MKLADKPTVMLRRTALWAAPLLLVITAFLVPVTNSKVKIFEILLLAITVIGGLVVLPPKLKVVTIVALIAATSLFLLPARDAATLESLPVAYDHALRRYEGVAYWWGGENAVGIDCSGLIRRGMIDATLREGLLRLDGGLLRASADIWWHDSSARALGEGYGGWTSPVTDAKSLNTLDHSRVRRGDLAIAGGGTHILAYLGDNQWIQADPTAQKVIVETAPSANGWFKGPVKVVRWKWLDPARSSDRGSSAK
jgi:hypothetical protein